jgi:osmoprotectant transport system permease protein
VLADVHINGPIVDWGWLGDHLDDARLATLEHLRLTVIAVAVGFVLAALLATLAVRYRWTLALITSVAGIIYTIPSLALFTMLVPITGLGTTLTAEIALVGYTLLILIRNFVAGIDGVPQSVRDAADGLGYTRGRRFLEVEVRLAVPSIVAGLRIATVSTVGLVTVTSLIGLGGLGGFIKEGLRRLFPTEILLGAVPSVFLAAAIDLVLVLIERALTPWLRHESRRERRLREAAVVT